MDNELKTSGDKIAKRLIQFSASLDEKFTKKQTFSLLDPCILQVTNLLNLEGDINLIFINLIQLKVGPVRSAADFAD